MSVQLSFGIAGIDSPSAQMGVQVSASRTSLRIAWPGEQVTESRLEVEVELDVEESVAGRW